MATRNCLRELLFLLLFGMVYSDFSELFCKNHPMAATPGKYSLTDKGFECTLLIRKKIKTHTNANRMCLDLCPWNLKKLYKKGDKIPFPVVCSYDHPYFCEHGSLIHDRCYVFSQRVAGKNISQDHCSKGFKPMSDYSGAAITFLSKTKVYEQVWVNISVDHGSVKMRQFIYGSSDPLEKSDKVLLMLRKDEAREWKLGDLLIASETFKTAMLCDAPASRMPHGPLPYGSVQEQYYRGLSRIVIQPETTGDNTFDISTMVFHQSCKVVEFSSAYFPADKKDLDTVKSIGKAPIYLPIRRHGGRKFISNADSTWTSKLRGLGIFGVQQRVPLAKGDIAVNNDLWRNDAPTNIESDWPRVGAILIDGKIVDVTTTARYPVFCLHDIVKIDGKVSSYAPPETTTPPPTKRTTPRTPPPTTTTVFDIGSKCPPTSHFDYNKRTCVCQGGHLFFDAHSATVESKRCMTCKKIWEGLCLQIMVDMSSHTPQRYTNIYYSVADAIVRMVPDSTRIQYATYGSHQELNSGAPLKSEWEYGRRHYDSKVKTYDYPARIGPAASGAALRMDEECKEGALIVLGSTDPDHGFDELFAPSITRYNYAALNIQQIIFANFQEDYDVIGREYREYPILWHIQFPQITEESLGRAAEFIVDELCEEQRPDPVG